MSIWGFNLCSWRDLHSSDRIAHRPPGDRHVCMYVSVKTLMVTIRQIELTAERDSVRWAELREWTRLPPAAA